MAKQLTQPLALPGAPGPLGTAALPARHLVVLLPYPFNVWGAHELRKWVVRRRESRRTRDDSSPA